MKIIFLDVDSVLNNGDTEARVRPPEGGSYIGIDPILMERLRTIVTKTDAHIVLSTTWREFEYFRDHLLEKMGHIASRVIGDTPKLYYKSRAEEINAWISSHPEIKIDKFIVIDDLGCDDLDSFGESFIQTYYHDGLTEELMQKCIEKLS